jgi:hypothetical protein
MTYRDRITEQRIVKVRDLVAHPANWRTHPKEQQDALAGALREVGNIDALTVRPLPGEPGKYQIVDGHLRANLMPDDAVRVDVTDLSDAEAAYVLTTKDPLAAMARADAERLGALLHDVKSGDAAVQAMLAGLAEEYDLFQKAPGAGGDEFDTTPQDGPTRCQAGDLWQLGDHRLVCGDSTDKATVERVMRGEKAVLGFSDPPYGINIDISWFSALNLKRGKPANKSNDTLQGDDGSLDLSCAFLTARWLVWGFPHIAHPGMTGWLVWDKWPGADNGLGNPVELALTNLWNGFRLIRLMWRGYYRAAGEKREPHPTQKPVGVCQPFIEQYTKIGDVVIDPFGGSGTTLIACERTGRQCRMVEIEPRYCDVILRRWEAETGRKAVLAERAA